MSGSPWRPMCFVIITTGSASIAKISEFARGLHGPDWVNNTISLSCLLAIDFCTTIVVLDALLAARKPAPPAGGSPVEPSQPVTSAAQ